jgi:hypothetical protein
MILPCRVPGIAAGWLLGVTLFSVPALAWGGVQFDQPQPRASVRSGMSLDEAVRRAERQFNARVVKAETITVDGRKTYVLRLVTGDGRVITVRVDADSGAMQ